MSSANFGDTVRVHYSGRLDDGTVFDSSTGHEPVEFTIGDGQVIPGFEEAVIGMQPGESKMTRIAPEKAYGPHYRELEIEMKRSDLPPSLDLQVGEQLELTRETSGSIPVIVKEISDSNIILDANHPLAGQELQFEIELLGIA